MYAHRAFCLLGLCAGAWSPIARATEENLAAGATVRASAEYEGAAAHHAVDGVATDGSRWMAPPSAAGHWLELTLAASATVRQAHVYSGYQQEPGSALRSLRLEQADGQGGWLPIPGAAIVTNQAFALALTFAWGLRIQLR